jgi:hypothetical protein
MAKPKIKHTITKKKWNKTHKDFKTTIDGTPYIMMYDDKVGTYLAPVKIVNETITEVERGDMGYVEKHKSIATIYDVMSGGKKVKVKLGKTGKVVVIDTKDIKILPESVNEMDLNDPVLVRLRAAQMKKNKDAADRLEKAKSDKEREKAEKLAARNATKIKALKKKRAEVMRDMEQEAEPGGGKIADRYGKLLNRIDNDIIKLGGNPMSESVNEGKVDSLKNAVQKINKNYKVQISKHPVTKGEVEIILGSGNHPDKDYDAIQKLVSKLGIQNYSIFDESVNEAYVVMYAKKKGEKPASAAFQLRGSALSFERDLKKDGYITMITQKKVKGVDESVVNEFKKLRNRRGDVDGLMVTHNGKEYQLVYSADFTMGGAIQPYGIVMPGDDVVSFLGKDKKAKSIWKQLKPKVDKFVKSNESVNESNDVYHKSYTHAIEAAEVYAKKKGYEIEDDEMFTKVGMNSKRPSVGKTTRVSLELLKNGKPQKKMLHIQVYGMKNGYELNAYIN